jgi:hypothetical protein
MRIVCAVDGSEFSQWGIGLVGALAERKPEHVTVLHVVNPAALSARGLNPVAEKQALSAMEKAGALLLREAVRAARVALGQSATAPLTQVLAVDLGTDMIPALGLGSEPPHEGVMDDPPRPRTERLLSRALLVRAYLFVGVIEAAFAMGGFFWFLPCHVWFWGAHGEWCSRL